MAKQCTIWQKGERRVYTKTCSTRRMKRGCRIAPAKWSGVPDEGAYTVSCAVSVWNTKNGEWRLVPRGKNSVEKSIFAAKQAADKFLKK